MNKLSSKLYFCIKSRIHNGMNTSSQAVASLQHQHFFAFAAQLACSQKTGRSRSYYNNICIVHFAIVSGTTIVPVYPVKKSGSCVKYPSISATINNAV